MATHQFSTCDLLTNLPQPHLNTLFTQARTAYKNEGRLFGWTSKEKWWWHVEIH